MSGSPRRKTPSLSLTRVPAAIKCKLALLRRSYALVAHPLVRLADLTDINFFLTPLDSSLFPGVPASMQAHSGFSSEQARYATRSDI